MAIDNLAQANAEIEKLWKRLERLERGAPIGFSAVSRGALRILSEEGLIVEGSARISGILDGDGELIWSGDISFTGPFTIDGVTTQNGEYTVNGAWHLIGDGDIAGDVNMTGLFDLTGDATLAGMVDITGTLKVSGPSEFSSTLAIKGATTLEADLNVKPGGKVIVEGAQSITLSSVGGTAMMRFSDGPRVWSASGGGRLDAGANTGIVLSTAEAAILRSPDTAKAVAVSDTGTRIFGDIYLNDLPAKSGVTANVFADPDTGKLSVA
jgi:hypothetical protein